MLERFSMKKKILVLLLPFLILLIVYLSVLFLFRFSDKYFFTCIIYWKTGILCPGCGGTRAVKALTEFRFIDSLRYNPSVLTMCIFSIYCYTQLLFNTFFRSDPSKKKIIPASRTFYLFWAGILLIYYIARNL